MNMARRTFRKAGTAVVAFLGDVAPSQFGWAAAFAVDET